MRNARIRELVLLLIGILIIVGSCTAIYNINLKQENKAILIKKSNILQMDSLFNEIRKDLDSSKIEPSPPNR